MFGTAQVDSESAVSLDLLNGAGIVAGPVIPPPEKVPLNPPSIFSNSASVSSVWALGLFLGSFAIVVLRF